MEKPDYFLTGKEFAALFQRSMEKAEDDAGLPRGTLFWAWCESSPMVEVIHSQ
jgi:hypothetical protein